MSERNILEENWIINKKVDYTSRTTKYIAEVKHIGLNEFNILVATDEQLLDQKIYHYKLKLNEKWKNVILTKEAKKASDEYKGLQMEIVDILSYSLNRKPDSIWEKIKDNSEFDQPHPEEEFRSIISNLKPPVKAKLPIKRELNIIPNRPIYRDPILTIFDYIFPSLKRNTLDKAKKTYLRELDEWQSISLPIKQQNEKNENDYKSEVEKIEIQFKIQTENLELYKKNLNNSLPNEISIWETKKEEFYVKKNAYLTKSIELKTNYLQGQKESIEKYNDLVLENSKYPAFVKKEYSVEYKIDNEILIIEYLLPTIDDFPKIIDVKYSKELKITNISNKNLQEQFESTLYKITFRTIFEIFKYDEISAIKCVVFNGWINGIDKATGRHQKKCIISLQAIKEEFNEIDLTKVDLKVCFKSLKGVSGAKIIDLTPIHPVLTTSKNDKRFVSNQAVAFGLNQETNLAAMDWEDFEHLIREVFEKEFSANGGEVKVTQASKDGGVDAIAFDPDPIRGGKIVIQAKRYTNTVGVSSVRDLYGTVMNEGATKGILVTTADFGPDSYEFAKGKPLTLLNGSNLLHLLEKHGHKARINIKEAKEILKGI